MKRQTVRLLRPSPAFPSAPVRSRSSGKNRAVSINIRPNFSVVRNCFFHATSAQAKCFDLAQTRKTRSRLFFSLAGGFPSSDSSTLSLVCFEPWQLGPFSALTHRPKIDHVDQLGSVSLGHFHCGRGLPFNTKPNTTLAMLETAYMSGLDAVDRIEARTRSNAASGKFTPEGVKDDTLKFALGDIVPVLHKARTTIKKAKAEVAERRSRLKLEGPDKSDVAAAFRRREIRTFLREMKGNDQKNYFARYGDDLPGEVTIAILEMPPELSGVPRSRHELLTARALQRDGVTNRSEARRSVADAEPRTERC
jgi:hypothetical protein